MIYQMFCAHMIGLSALYMWIIKMIASIWCKNMFTCLSWNNTCSSKVTVSSSMFLKKIKMISAQHLSNNGKNKVTKKASGHGRFYGDLGSEADPRKIIELEAIHVQIKTHILR